MPKINELENTATSIAADDYIPLSGTINGTRKILATSVGGGANTSLSNLTTAGKYVVANLAMPSSSYIDLTLGTSNSTYTAPADGYLHLYKTTTASGQYAYFTCGRINELISCTPVSGYSVTLLLPVKKNDVVTYVYTAAGSTTYFRFIYAQGEV